jgi:hypothetical protein
VPAGQAGQGRQHLAHRRTGRARGQIPAASRSAGQAGGPRPGRHTTRPPGALTVRFDATEHGLPFPAWSLAKLAGFPVTGGRVATTIITWCAGAAERSGTPAASRASDLPGSGGRRRLPGRRGRCHVLGTVPAVPSGGRLTARARSPARPRPSRRRWRRTMPGSFGLRTSRPAGAGRPGRHDQTTSNRSRFITLSQAATKSFTNFSFASSLA